MMNRKSVLYVSNTAFSMGRKQKSIASSSNVATQAVLLELVGLSTTIVIYAWFAILSNSTVFFMENITVEPAEILFAHPAARGLLMWPI